MKRWKLPEFIRRLGFDEVDMRIVGITALSAAFVVLWTPVPPCVLHSDELTTAFFTNPNEPG
jgi:hypothetical protein